MTDLSGKVAIVTGASRGIGREVAVMLAAHGASVVVNSTDASKGATNVVSAILNSGGKAVAVSGDVGMYTDCERIVSTAVESFGGVDILVNNAGITRDNLVMRMTEQEWDSVLNTNLKGAFGMTKAASRIMLKQRSGCVVNITSVAGIMGNAGQANYCSSKAGMIGLTKSVAREFAARGVRCNAVAPGFIHTDMTASLPDSIKEACVAQIPLKRFGEASDVASIVLYLASDCAKYITGQVINVDGGLS